MLVASPLILTLGSCAPYPPALPFTHAICMSLAPRHPPFADRCNILSVHAYCICVRNSQKVHSEIWEKEFEREERRVRLPGVRVTVLLLTESSEAMATISPDFVAYEEQV